MRHCFNITFTGAALHRNTNELIALFYRSARLFKLCNNRLKMLWDNVADYYIALCGGGSNHICSRFYLVGNNAVRGAVKMLDTANFNNRGTRTHNIGAHRVKEVCKVNYMRFSCGIFNNCHSTDRNHIEIYRATRQLICAGNNHTRLNSNLGAECFEALDMLVDRAQTYCTTSGRRNLCLAASAEKRTKKVA